MVGFSVGTLKCESNLTLIPDSEDFARSLVVCKLNYLSEHPQVALGS